jgi:phospholipid/cholesterol/gamma-HCH transport system permease protein
LTAARLQVEAGEAGRVVVRLSGDWLQEVTLPGMAEVEQAVNANAARTLDFEAASLGRWNSGLVAFLVKCATLCRQRQLTLEAGDLPAGAVRLLRLSEAVPERRDAARGPRPGGLLRRVGEGAFAMQGGARAAATFLGESTIALLKLVRRRARFRWADTFLVMQQCGPEALAIVALINFLVGLILAFVGTLQLARFGATIYSADLVAIATVREMGCLMTGIIMCGRTGAAFAAQLGTMRVNQEIEAFQTFGISPFEFLVLPRFLALVLMMPLLCVFADLIAILGGFTVSTLMLEVSPALYLRRTVEAISLTSFLLGIGKGTFFGMLIALTGCQRGMQCGTNAAAVGQATTLAVVTGITAIIASDGVFAVLCSALGI